MPGCRKILFALERGESEGWIDAVTIHELTYALPRARPKSFRTRDDVYQYLVRFLALDAVHADDKESVIAALQWWRERTGSFGDARLVALARSRRMGVCTVNEGDFVDIRNTYRQP